MWGGNAIAAGDRSLANGLDRDVPRGHIIDLLGDLVHPEDKLRFFEERHPLLMNMRPIDLLDTPEGMEALEKVLRGVATGAFQ